MVIVLDPNRVVVIIEGRQEHIVQKSHIIDPVGKLGVDNKGDWVGCEVHKGRLVVRKGKETVFFDII